MAREVAPFEKRARSANVSCHRKTAPFVHRDLIIELAAPNRLPAICRTRSKVKWRYLRLELGFP